MKKNYLHLSAFSTLVSFVLLAGSVSYGQDTITTICGLGTGLDGTLAVNADIDDPVHIYVDDSLNKYISTLSLSGPSKIRKIDGSTGIITTIAGVGTTGFSGDGGLATAAQINWPAQMTMDSAGNIYFCDMQNWRVRKITASTGIITTVAGNGSFGYAGDGGQATSASLYATQGVALDKTQQNLYIGDAVRIRKVNLATGIITTFAGTGSSTSSGDGGQAINAGFGVHTICFDTAGNLYISEGLGHKIRKIDTAGIITTVAGTGTAGYSGDGGQATAAMLSAPQGIHVSKGGKLLIAERNNDRVRSVDLSTGIITTFAGNGMYGFSGDGGPATAAQLETPCSVFTDKTGTTFIGDGHPTGTGTKIRRVGSNSELGVKNFKQFISAVYPNPCTGIFTIEFADHGKWDIEIFDAVGKRILSTSVNSKQAQINLLSHVNGSYYVKVSGGNTASWQKIIVKK